MKSTRLAPLVKSNAPRHTSFLANLKAFVDSNGLSDGVQRRYALRATKPPGQRLSWVYGPRRGRAGMQCNSEERRVPPPVRTSLQVTRRQFKRSASQSIAVTAWDRWVNYCKGRSALTTEPALNIHNWPPRSTVGVIGDDINAALARCPRPLGHENLVRSTTEFWRPGNGRRGYHRAFRHMSL